jgi:hypothetical protein
MERTFYITAAKRAAAAHAFPNREGDQDDMSPKLQHRVDEELAGVRRIA